MLFPYRIDTLLKHYPVANWAIMALTVLAYCLMAGGLLPEDALYAMVLEDWSAGGLLGHGLLHADVLHLAGNMVFLWVFGNAVCGNTSNVAYPFLYAGFLLASGSAHLLLDGAPALGASGAVNGVVGMALAMYPLNRVSVFYWVWFWAGSFLAPLWGLALFWLGFDLLGVLLGWAGTAYWAHLGGFVVGLATGWVALRAGWVKLHAVDHRSLEEILGGKTAEARRERLRSEEAPEDGGV